MVRTNSLLVEKLSTAGAGYYAFSVSIRFTRDFQCSAFVA